MKRVIASALLCLLTATAALADPPGYAPAHGWRKQHDPRYEGHRHPREYRGMSGAAYHEDYGILSGRCDRDKIGTVIGGVTGAVIGSQVTREEDRVVGIVVGGVLGALLGRTVGREIDRNDRACMGHALDLGRPGVPVVWRGDDHIFRFTPLGETRGGCRYASLEVDRRQPRDVIACPTARGEWAFRGP